ncbi:hypothetical protein IVA74_32110 [Bradyrhizobium sp. 132]|nr:hypothetical protein [Bradyrhizobium sp. 132]
MASSESDPCLNCLHLLPASATKRLARLMSPCFASCTWSSSGPGSTFAIFKNAKSMHAFDQYLPIERALGILAVAKLDEVFLQLARIASMRPMAVKDNKPVAHSVSQVAQGCSILLDLGRKSMTLSLSELYSIVKRSYRDTFS